MKKVFYSLLVIFICQANLLQAQVIESIEMKNDSLAVNYDSVQPIYETQSQFENQSRDPFTHEAGWQIYYEDEKIAIEHRIFEITDATTSSNYEIVAFRFVNKTNERLSLYFDREVIYSQGCTACDHDASGEISLLLNPYESIDHNDFPTDKRFYLYRKDLTPSVNEQMLMFQLNNFRIIGN